MVSPAPARVNNQASDMATSGSRLAAFRERKQEEKRSSQKEVTSKKKRGKEEAKNEGPKRLLQAALESEVKEPAFMGLAPTSRFFDVLTAQEVRDLRTVFDAFDGKSRGTINEQEMQTAMTALGFRISEQEIQEAVSDMGITNSKIEFENFLSVVVDRQGDARDAHEEIIQVFKMLDRSGQGRVTLEDLMQACADAGETLTEKELSDMIYEADQDGDNAVSQAEFMQIMLKTNLFQ